MTDDTREESIAMFAISFLEMPQKPEAQTKQESIAERVRRREAQEIVNRQVDLYISSQSLYLGAIGSLIQFNAFMAAVGCASLASSDTKIMKIAAAASLASHAFAGFRLCWSARPEAYGETKSERQAYLMRKKLSADTFRGYQAGWSWTMFAIGVSIVGAVLYIAKSFGWNM